MVLNKHKQSTLYNKTPLNGKFFLGTSQDKITGCFEDRLVVNVWITIVSITYSLTFPSVVKFKAETEMKYYLTEFFLNSTYPEV